MITEYKNKEIIIEKFRVLFPNKEISQPIVFFIDSSNGQERYEITSTDKGIKLQANSEAGLLYALIDLSQGKDSIQIESLSNERGLNIDCGRKFYSKDWFLSMIRRMSRLKMNVLQIHFSENEGFRLELNKFKEVLSEQYLSQKELKEILNYAKYFYIEVQPSFDSPGHMQKILEVYPEHRLENSKTALDITKKGSRDFVKEIYDEVLTMFPNARTIHMGGDEFIPFDDYHKYPSLDKYAKDTWGTKAEGFDTYLDYINDVSTYLLDKGLKVKVWNDGLYRVNQKPLNELDSRLIVTYWTSWNANMAPLKSFIDKGHQVINFMDQYLYFVLGENAGYIYPTKEEITDDFKVNQFPLRHESLNVAREQAVQSDNPQFLGTFYSIWSDKPEAHNEDEVYNKTRDSMKAFAKKSWKALYKE